MTKWITIDIYCWIALLVAVLVFHNRAIELFSIVLFILNNIAILLYVERRGLKKIVSEWDS